MNVLAKIHAMAEIEDVDFGNVRPPRGEEVDVYLFGKCSGTNLWFKPSLRIHDTEIQLDKEIPLGVVPKFYIDSELMKTYDANLGAESLWADAVMHAIIQFADPKVTMKARDGVLTVKLKFPAYDGLGCIPISEFEGALELD